MNSLNQTISTVKSFGKSSYQYQLQLTKRDREIIRYLCEMKFASTTDVYERFFKVLADGRESASMRWARERLFRLEKDGYVKKVRNFQINENFFLGTLKGHEEAMNIVSSLVLPKPSETIDVRIFDHDWLVLKIRNVLEKVGQSSDWKSDRLLMNNQVFLEGFSPDYFPDGVYRNFENKHYAFELELAQKGRSCYQEKIAKYVKYIRENQLKADALKKVHFIAPKKAVLEILKAEIRLFPEFFVVEDLAKYAVHLGGKND